MIKPARGSILQIFLRLGYAQKSVRIHNGMCIAKSGLERQLATMRIHLANDHAAGDLRVALIAWLKERGIEVVDHVVAVVERRLVPGWEYQHRELIEEKRPLAG